MESLIQFLIAATIKASLLIMLLFAIHLLFSRWLAPRWRHLLWGLVAIRLLMPAVFESNLSLFNLGAELKQSTPVGVHNASAMPEESVFVDVEALPAATPEISPAPSVSARLKSVSLHQIAFGVWLAGVVIFLLLVLRATWRFHRAVKKEPRSTDSSLLGLLEDCRRELGITAKIALIETSLVTTPALLGILRPKVLLPKSMIQQLSAKELRFVFLHELTHLKRRDILINWLVMFAQIIHWFNPLVWLAFLRMHAEREQACDETVLSSIDESDRKLYGHTLIELMGAQPAPLATVGMVGILERNKQLKRRIGMIRQFKHKPVWQAVLACCIAVTVGVITLTDAAAKSNPAKPALKVKTEPGKGKQITVEVKIFELNDGAKITCDTVKTSAKAFVFSGKAKVEFEKGKEPNVLSAPKVTVANGKLATISMVKERDDDREPDGTVVKVTPTLVKKGITLAVDVSVVVNNGETKAKSSVTATVAAIPGEPVYICDPGKKLMVMLTAHDAANPPKKVKPPQAQLALQKKLKSITITKISVEDAPISTVFDFLKLRSRELDREGKGVNILLKLPKGKDEPTVTMDLEDVDLETMLKAICRMTDLKYRVGDHAVLVGDFKPVKKVKAEKKTELHKKLDKLVITKVSLEETPLSMALEFLNVRSRQLDPDGKGANIVLVNRDKKKMPTVTVDLDNMPMSQAIRFICQAAGATYEIKEKMVVVTIK